MCLYRLKIRQTLCPGEPALLYRSQTLPAIPHYGANRLCLRARQVIVGHSSVDIISQCLGRDNEKDHLPSLSRFNKGIRFSRTSRSTAQADRSGLSE